MTAPTTRVPARGRRHGGPAVLLAALVRKTNIRRADMPAAALLADILDHDAAARRRAAAGGEAR
jgi:hypothetical protein